MNIRYLEALAILTFFILLGAAIYMLVSFYVCDHMNCKAFNEANEKATPGTKEYSLALLQETFNDGIWPIPYIGAAILTPLALWFLEYPITVRTFAILFFISFVVIYFMFSFFGHHYLNPITNYVYTFIETDPSNATNTILENGLTFNPYYEF